VKRLIAVAALALASSPAFADEGMWTFDNFPSAAVKAKYGVTIDQKWLAKVQDGAARFGGGCSSSIISPDGLVLTNHHCVRSCVQLNSTASADYIKDGFMPAKREDEKLCPGVAVEVLKDITDVTARINTATAGAQDFVKARDAAIAAIEKEACKGRDDKFRCQVTTLYQGGQYKLYTYRRYTDVRLAFAPEEQIAFFGGDPDNFNFPRYNLDFGMVRLYEDGKPAKTPNHLKWSTSNPKLGEPVFVAGNPGSTSRLMTVAELEALRDIAMPDALLMLAEVRGVLEQFSTQSPEHARVAKSLLFGVENSYKGNYGRFQTLLDPAMMASKRAAEADLKAKVKADPKLAAATGDAWGELEAVKKAQTELEPAYLWLEARAGFRSDLFAFARTIVRGTAERDKPNSERLREFTDSRLKIVEKNLSDARPVYPELEKVMLTFWLTKLREHLTADAEGTKVFLGKESPESLAEKLVASKLADPAVRKALWQGGKAAVEKSDDPMIKFVLATDAASRAARKTYEDRVEGPSDRADEKIAKARFAVYGTATYPDATLSLRLSYGAVEGWNEKGKPVPAFTYFPGLYDRATGKFPFDLPPRWVGAKDKLSTKTVFDFATTNDIIGGNSGSPVLNAKGEVIGAAFDGNIESLGGDYWYDGSVNRTVVVTTAAIAEALKKVYGQDRLVKELTGK
jgi:V8-like Glu-specific endopeptidase